MNTQPLISVLMGIYNCETTLPDAIDSIIEQTYTNWELILCDDGSTDKTYEIARGYASRLPDKIKLIKHEKNSGLNKTLNDCLAEAKGEYIARMDGDDISIKERFEKELSVLRAEDDIVLVSCPMIYFDETGDWAKGSVGAEYPAKEMLARGTVHCHAPCMVRTDVMRKVGGYTEHKRLLRVEDWHLWVKIYSFGYQGKNLSEHLYKMRDDRNAASRRKFKYRFNEAYVSLSAVKMLKLSKKNYIYAIRPILVGLLPTPLYMYLHKKKINSKAEKNDT